MDGADGVYPPSEDTFLLINALEKDISLIKTQLTTHPICVEIGSGSGEVSKAVSSFLPNSFVLSTDVNPLAALRTLRTLSSSCNNSKTDRNDIILTDLFTAFNPKVTNFEVIIFNPPYVPTDEAELERALSTRDISASWAGGPRSGRHVIDLFLKGLSTIIDKRSRYIVYLVLLEENHPDDVIRLAKEQCEFVDSSVVLKRRAGIETLYIVRFTSFKITQ